MFEQKFDEGRERAMTPKLVEVTRDELHQRRLDVLAFVGLEEAELRRLAEDHRASPDELDAWRELESIDFLLGDNASGV